MLKWLKDRLLDAIFLYICDKGESTIKLLKAILKVWDDIISKLPQFNTPENLVYIALLRSILEEDIDFTDGSQRARLLVKIGSDLKKSKLEMERITKLIESAATSSPRKEAGVRILSRRLNQWVCGIYLDESVRKMTMLKSKAADTSDVQKQEDLFKEILSTAQKMIDTKSSYMQDEHVDTISTGDTSSIVRALKQYKAQRQSTALKMGLHGFNRILGSDGIHFGEFVMFSALSGNGKSMTLKKMARWVCQYNSPPKINPDMHPAVVYFSLEQEISEVIASLYQELKILNGESPDLSDVSEEDEAQYVQHMLELRGWRLFLERVTEDFGLTEYDAAMAKYKSAGYKVYVSLIDYFILMRLDADGRATDAQQRQKLAHSLYERTVREQMITVTAMQLGPEADALAGSGQTNVVKRFRSSMLGDCKGAMREATLWFYQHIETNQDGVPFLTNFQVKKRNGPPQSLKDRYSAYQFEDAATEKGLIGVMDDINGPDMSISDIYQIHREQVPTTESGQTIPQAIPASLFG